MILGPLLALCSCTMVQNINYMILGPLLVPCSYLYHGLENVMVIMLVQLVDSLIVAIFVYHNLNDILWPHLLDDGIHKSTNVGCIMIPS